MACRWGQVPQDSFGLSRRKSQGNMVGSAWPISAVPVFAAVFLIGWQEDFPETAVTSLMIDRLHMSPSAMTTAYTLAFLPWMWKPAYGWLSDTVPFCGFHRKPYFLLSAVGAAGAYVILSSLVSSPQALVVTNIWRGACTAMLQLMTDSFVIDLARRGVDSPSALQGCANAFKWLGTGQAQLVAFFTYANAAQRKPGVPLRYGQQAIGCTALAPGVLVLLSPTLPETKGHFFASTMTWPYA
eukprot:2516956-Amphidinium_carterae.1